MREGPTKEREGKGGDGKKGRKRKEYEAHERKLEGRGRSEERERRKKLEGDKEGNWKTREMRGKAIVGREKDELGGESRGGRRKVKDVKRIREGIEK